MDNFSKHLDLELEWFTKSAQWQFNHDCFQDKSEWPLKRIYNDLYEITPPTLEGESRLKTLIKTFELGHDERLILMLAIINIYQPESIYQLFFSWPYEKREKHPVLGGYEYQEDGILPTGRTAIFLLAETETSKIGEAITTLRNHPLIQNGLLVLEKRPLQNYAVFSSILKASDDLFDYLINQRELELKELNKTF